MIDTLLHVFRKVSLMEDSDQNIHLKNLSVHQANCEEEALNLLFLGDTNRMIAEVSLHLYIYTPIYTLRDVLTYLLSLRTWVCADFVSVPG